MVVKKFKIDVEKALRDKSKDPSKKPNSLVVKFLKRIIHQDEINAFLEIHGDKEGYEFITEALKYMNLTVKLNGEENLPSHGRYTFVSNHPLGGLDGMSLALQLNHKYPGVKVLANDLLMNFVNLHPIFLPVNKHGGQARESAIILTEAYESSTPLLIYPAGLVSRLQGFKIRYLEWKKTFVSKTIRSKRDVVPIHISGKNSAFFYILAKIRKILGIKINLEMLFLAHEMLRFKNKEITITFGKPISYKFFDKSKSPDEWAQYVKDEVYKLVGK